MLVELKQLEGFTKSLSAELLDIKKPGQGIVLLLNGNLGAGKTTFTQHLSRLCAISENVVSPTFVVMKVYIKDPVKTSIIPSVSHIYHLDAYRLEGSVQKDLEILHLKESIMNPQNIVCIEWPEIITAEAPDFFNEISYTIVDFSYVSQDARNISYTHHNY